MKLKYIPVSQNDKEKMIVFSAPAEILWNVLSINKRDEDKIEGYQRTLSISRAEQIKRYVINGKSISPAIIISFDSGEVQVDENELTIEFDENKKSIGWVIDGQHRLRGAELASKEGVSIELPVVAYIGLELDRQIEQFVTINREAKGVPTSLYYDLLKQLPEKKNPSEMAKEKAVSIANYLRKNPESVFYEKIAVFGSPKIGQISLNNFVRKVYPLLVESKGSFFIYSQQEFSQMLENYFGAIKVVFPKEFVDKKIFFKTLGFGAMLNAFQTVFSITVRQKSSFTRDDCIELLKRCSPFDFSGWGAGSGTAAENQAGRDFEIHFRVHSSENHDGNSSTIKLT